MKIRTVKFSYGTVKDASLKIPAESYSIMDVVRLIRESYLEYAFRPGCGIMSDECLTSSIGQENFFQGALGGYESRVDAETFAAIKRYAEDKMGLAVMIAKTRQCNSGLPSRAVYAEASKNEALSQEERAALAHMAVLA